MMVALLIHGVKPGPVLMEQHPEVFWGLIASMYIGNVMLLILNLPMVGLFVNLLRVPQHVLFPFILLICFVGVYSVGLSVTDLWIMAIAGVAGYVLRKIGFDPAPIVLAMVLGPMMEQALRQALMMSKGEFRDLREPPHRGRDAGGRASAPDVSSDRVSATNTGEAHHGNGKPRRRSTRRQSVKGSPPSATKGENPCDGPS